MGERIGKEGRGEKKEIGGTRMGGKERGGEGRVEEGRMREGMNISLKGLIHLLSRHYHIITDCIMQYYRLIIFVSL